MSASPFCWSHQFVWLICLTVLSPVCGSLVWSASLISCSRSSHQFDLPRCQFVVISLCFVSLTSLCLPRSPVCFGLTHQFVVLYFASLVAPVCEVLVSGCERWVYEIAVESLKSHSIPIQKLSRNSGQVS